MRSIAFAVSAIATVASVTSVWADAVVSPVNGSVLVSQGRGFVRQAQPTNLKVGDRVMVAQGSRAKIVYGDGCSVSLLPGAVQVIKPASPCASKSQQAQDPNDGRYQALVPGQNDPESRNYIGYLVGGGVVALGATSAIISLNEKNAPFIAPATSP